MKKKKIIKNTNYDNLNNLDNVTGNAVIFAMRGERETGVQVVK